MVSRSDGVSINYVLDMIDGEDSEVEDFQEDSDTDDDWFPDSQVKIITLNVHVILFLALKSM